ncbi:MAG TPA: PqqD family protein [Bacteroidales bacterium]|nr:PqqD family protein [Bacteroidales bacterium]
MEATPIRSCDFETAVNGLVTLVVPKFKNEKLNNFLLGARKRFFKIALDELGTAVWLNIDGQRKVADICQKVFEMHGNKIMPVEQRVTKFLTMLYEGRYITFAEIEKFGNKE